MSIKVPEIKTEYKDYVVKINNKEIRLVYKIIQYQLLKNQTGEYVKKLRKQNIKIKAFKFKNKNTDEVQIYYYKLYAEKIFNLKYRYKRIMGILNKIDDSTGKEVVNNILYVWENKNYHKTNKNKLKDKESTILDILGSYYLAEFEQEYILTKKKEKEIEKYEILKSNIFKTIEKVDKKYKRGIEISIKQQIEKWQQKNRMQTKRWKKSKTYKINQLYSYDNYRDRHYEWDFVKEKWIYCDKKYQITKKRLINPKQPYVAKWCLVDTDGVFEFNKQKYLISNELKQYQKKEISYKIFKDEYEMDKILVIEQGNKKYYFDQNIECIDNKYIKSIKGK